MIKEANAIGIPVPPPNPQDLEVTRLWLEGRYKEAEKLHTFEPSMRFVRSFKWEVLHIIASWNGGELRWRGPLHLLRRDYGDTNLFDEELGWTSAGKPMQDSLDDVFDRIRVGDVWVSDNCRIQIVVDRPELEECPCPTCGSQTPRKA